MRIEDFTFEVRDENLNRLGQILPGDLVGWESVLRFNNVGVWSIEMVATIEMAQLLSTPGYGIIVTHKDAGVILSGPTISAETTYEQGDPLGVTKIMGVDDSVILADRLAYPQPSNADVATQTSAYDSVSFMQASTAMYWYVERNLKPGVASATRAIPNLTIATDTGIGSDISKSARFDVLGTLLADIAAIDGLGFDIKQVDGNLEFNVFQPTDRSGTIRMDVANQTLSKTSFGYGAPQITHAIVAGQGQGLNRQLIDVTTTDSLSAESLFARRIESFIDQRNTGDVDELTQAGLEKLADGGQTQTSVDVIPSSDITMQYGTDWNLGDKVTVVVANQEVSATVTQVSIKVESNGVFIGATVGEPNGVDFEAIVTRKQTNSATRVDALERKETPAIVWNDEEGTYEFVMKGGNVTQQIGAEQLAYVKNNTGATIANGSVVYPNGSTGTNNLILKAQANAESTSTKTFGVVTEDIANGGHGWVTTFGMVHDINTSALTEGGAVYLSPTVAGGMTSTKPSSRTRTNLVANPNFETNISGYGASNGTLTRDTVSPITGTASMKCTATGTVASLGFEINPLTSLPQIIAGQTYTWSASFKTTFSTSARIDWAWYDEAGTRIGGYNAGTTASMATGIVQRLWGTQVAPTGATRLKLYFYVFNNVVSGTAFFVDSVMIEQSSTLEEYFDGSTTTYVGASCSWTGTANASTSIAKVNEHMVLVGFCVRSHAVNGSVFVKVQNGFELNELHDVAISSLASGDLLVRNAENTSWENKTLSAAGITPAGIGAAPTVHTHAATDVTSGTFNIARFPTVSVPYGGTGATTLASGGYLKGAGTSAITSQAGIPAGDITSGNLAIAQGGTSATTGAGLIPIIPTSVSSTGGTSSFSSTTGKITFSGAVTALVIDGIFSATYTNYRIVFNPSGGGDYLYIRSVNAGVVNSTAGAYAWQMLGAQSGVIYYGASYYSTSDSGMKTSALSSINASISFDVMAPYSTALTTRIHGQGNWAVNQPTIWNFMGNMQSASRTTGLQLFPNSSTFSGTISIYGYRD